MLACCNCRGIVRLPQRRLIISRQPISRQSKRFIALASKQVPRLVPELDDELSNRWIDLDPAGYFIIKIDRDTKSIIAEHYTNTINKNGLACDPETGEPIACSAGGVRLPTKVYTGATAKELSVLLCECDSPPLTRLEHANYLGRELQRAEMALISGDEYVQD